MTEWKLVGKDLFVHVADKTAVSATTFGVTRVPKKNPKHADKPPRTRDDESTLLFCATQHFFYVTRQYHMPKHPITS